MRSPFCRLTWARLGLFFCGTLLCCGFSLAEEPGRRNVVSNIPAKVHGRWPNDARDTFWHSDYETASRIARQSGRPLLLVINRGAVCEV
jgi:hypothetical protein